MGRCSSSSYSYSVMPKVIARAGAFYEFYACCAGVRAVGNITPELCRWKHITTTFIHVKLIVPVTRSMENFLVAV